MNFSIRICLLCMSIFQIHAGNLYVEKEAISLSLKDASVEQILDLIEKETDYTFLFTDKTVDVGRRVNIDLNTGNIKEALGNLFHGTNVEYNIVNKQVILSTKTKAAPNPAPGDKITGTVIDEKGEPVIGANIVQKGTTNGTITDIDGHFSLAAPDNSTLQITYIGYVTQEIPIKGQTTLSVTLHENAQNLEEVVVIGYGTAKRKDLTGSISSIKAEKMEAEAPRDITDLMRGTAAGLNVGMSTSAKGDLSPSIRGKSTLTAGSDPTLVVDGVIYYGALSDLNTNDVESIDVLKDASSAAVYGSQAANGVIVITTKKGKGKEDGTPLITVNANVGIVQSANQMDVLDGKGYIKYRQDYEVENADEGYLEKYPEMFTNPFELGKTGVDPLNWYNYNQKTPVTSVTDEQLTRAWLSRLHFFKPEIDNYLAGKGTDWSKEVLHTGLQQDYTVGISNRTDKVSYRWSIGYVDREGIIVGDDYQNIRTRLNLDSKVTKFLTVGLNANFAVRNESAQAVSWNAMVKNSPYAVNTYDDPESPYCYYIVSDNQTQNPLYARQYRDQSEKYYSLNANLYAKVSLPFGIEYQFNYTPYLQWYNELYHQSAKSIVETNKGTSHRQLDFKDHWTVDNIFRWKKEFNKAHNIELTFLVNAEKRRTWSTTAANYGYEPSDVLGYHKISAGIKPTVDSNDTYWTGDALMGRLFYSYKNKYMLTASVRRDGYSAFGVDNKRATFPSVALGYVFTSEDYMKGTSHWLNYGKLRFSWGQNGNRDIGQYAALSNMNTDPVPYIDDSGSTYKSMYLYVNTMENKELCWEKTESFNLGLDFSLFNDLLTGSIDVYKGTTNDLLVDRSLSSVSGFDKITANLGKLQNKGLEVTLNANIMRRDNFEWSASSMFSMNRRKIEELYGDMEDILDKDKNVIGQKEADDITNKWFIGQDPDRIWDYKRDGVWQLGEEEKAAVYGNKPGDFKYIDQNGDGVLNNDDRVFQGYKTPRYRLSLRNDLTVFKDFTFSFSLYSYIGQYGAFNEADNYVSGMPYRQSYYDMPRWTKDNPTNDYARISSTNKGNNWVKKSFIRLDNIALSYNVPGRILKKTPIRSLRATLTSRNLAVWSPQWDFWDPENGSLSPRSFTLGINFTL